MVVNVKLPEFWSEAAHVWFVQANIEFAVKSVSVESTKFSYVVAALPESVALRVADALMDPDPSNPYTVIKERLLKVFTLNDYQRAERLLDLPPMGDERPTAIMDRMLALLPDDANREQPGFLFRTLFLRKLPADIRSHLIALKGESMRSLAEKGDVFWTTRPSAALHCVEPADVECMAVAAPPPRRGGGGFCWYHATHGKDATKCRSPCSWKAGNGRGGGK